MPSSQTEPASERKPSPRTIVAILLGALLVLFALLNSQSVTVHWLVGTTTVPLILVIAGCGLIGFAVGWLFARHTAHRKTQ